MASSSLVKPTRSNIFWIDLQQQFLKLPNSTIIETNCPDSFGNDPLQHCSELPAVSFLNSPTQNYLKSISFPFHNTARFNTFLARSVLQLLKTVGTDRRTYRQVCIQQHCTSALAFTLEFSSGNASILPLVWDAFPPLLINFLDYFSCSFNFQELPVSIFNNNYRTDRHTDMQACRHMFTDAIKFKMYQIKIYFLNSWVKFSLG